MSIAKDSTLRRALPLPERVALEGDPYATYNQLENATLADGNTVASLAFMSLSRAFWIESIQLSSNKAVVLQVSLGTSVQSNQQTVIRVALPAGGAQVIPIRALYRLQHQSAATAALGSVTVRKALDTTTGAYVYASLHGWAVYDDVNYAADKVMLHIGDSISNDTAGVTSKMKSMLWQTRGYFKAKGQNVRVINRSISGSTTADHEFRRSLGGYDFPQVDYIAYQLGTNDAGQGVSASTAQANLAAMILQKQKMYPAAKMIVFGATPRENSTYETALVAIRAAQQAAVAAASDPKVLWCSLAGAFDRTNTANFASSDTAGDRIHPSDAGHAAAYSTIAAFLDANVPTI